MTSIYPIDHEQAYLNETDRFYQTFLSESQLPLISLVIAYHGRERELFATAAYLYQRKLPASEFVSICIAGLAWPQLRFVEVLCAYDLAKQDYETMTKERQISIDPGQNAAA